MGALDVEAGHFDRMNRRTFYIKQALVIYLVLDKVGFVLIVPAI